MALPVILATAARVAAPVALTAGRTVLTTAAQGFLCGVGVAASFAGVATVAQVAHRLGTRRRTVAPALAEDTTAQPAPLAAAA